MFEQQQKMFWKTLRKILNFHVEFYNFKLIDSEQATLFEALVEGTEKHFIICYVRTMIMTIYSKYIAVDDYYDQQHLPSHLLGSGSDIVACREEILARNDRSCPFS